MSPLSQWTAAIPPLKQWKSMIASIVTAFAAFVLFAPEFFTQWPIVTAISKFAFAGGLAAWGISKNLETSESQALTLSKLRENTSMTADTQSKIGALEDNTNNKMDQLLMAKDKLLAVSVELAHAAGLKEGESNTSGSG